MSPVVYLRSSPHLEDPELAGGRPALVQARRKLKTTAQGEEKALALQRGAF